MDCNADRDTGVQTLEWDIHTIKIRRVTMYFVETSRNTVYICIYMYIYMCVYA